MSNDATRAHHFARLNSYCNSAEYAEFAKAVGLNDAPQGNLPSMIGDRWQINEDIYMEFLEMLPPMGWRGGSFYMREFSFGDITTKFTREGGKYYCEFARYPAREPRQSVTATEINQQGCGPEREVL